MSVWNMVIHPNITPLLGMSFDFDRPRMPCLISPYYPHGSITDYIKEHPKVDKLPLVCRKIESSSYTYLLS
jgi:hypothetical protein